MSQLPSPAKAVVVPLFVLPKQTIFPFEECTLDARTGANISLVGSLLSVGSQAAGSSVSFTPQIAIATTCDAGVATLAVPEPAGSVTRWVGGALRASLRCVSACHVLRLAVEDDAYDMSRWSFDRGYELFLVMPFSDIPSPSLTTEKWFPVMGLGQPAKAREGIRRTRYSLRQKRSRRQSLRTSVFPGISWQTWMRSFNEKSVLAQIRSLAASVDTVQKLLNIDDSLTRTTPEDKGSPAEWSFWFAAALSDSLSLDEQTELLSERVPILRLRKVLQLFHSALNADESKLGRGSKRQAGSARDSDD